MSPISQIYPTYLTLCGEVNTVSAQRVRYVGYCSLSFVCQFNLLPLQRELRGPQRKWRLYSIVICATLLAYGLYNVVIFSGYFNVNHVKQLIH